MRVLVCGGGTGGHIYPALAVVAELRQRGLDKTEFMWIGTQGQMEEELVPRAGLKLATIAGGPIVGVAPHKRLLHAARLAWSLGKSNRHFRHFRPDVLFMTGGYVNAPVALVARLRRVPAAIFLPDIEPGTAIRLLSRFVDTVACTAAASKDYFRRKKVAVTGYPVRPELRQALQMTVAGALATFDLGTRRATLLVFGGSRGARSINRALMDNLLPLLERYQIIHVSGTLDWPQVEAHASRLPETSRRFYRPYPYLHERMGAAFRAADLAVARAGASMLGESPAFGLPSVLIPYPHAWQYQKVNANYLVQHGAAIRLDDDLLAEQLLATVQALLNDEARLAGMAKAAKSLDKPAAAGNLAQLLTQLAAGQKVDDAW